MISIESSNTGNHGRKRYKSAQEVVPFDISPLNDITNVIGNSRQPGQRRENQSNFNRNYSCINLTDNDLVENTVTYDSDVPVGSIGISKKHNWTINTSQRIVPGFLVSTNARNNPSKRLKLFEDVFPLQNSPLSDITNVIDKDRPYGKRLGKQVQTQILTDITINNAFTNLDNNNLFENTLTYGTDVMVNRSWLSNTASSTNPGSINSINSGIHTSSQLIHDVVPLRSSPLGHITNVINYARPPVQCRGTQLQTQNTNDFTPNDAFIDLTRDNLVENSLTYGITNPEDGVAIVIDKPKRAYVRRNIATNLIAVNRLPRSIIDDSVDIVEVVQKQPLPRMNISRRSRRSVLELRQDKNVIDHPVLPSEYGDLGDAYECQFCHAEFWLDERCQKKAVDHTINKGSGPRIFRLHGQNYHLIGSLLPEDGTTPKFAQMYIYDTENEVLNRKNSVRRSSGDFDNALGPRDIVVELKSGKLRRINELNISYLALQYPLLLPYGEDGFTEDIPLTSQKNITENGRKYISVREYFAFRLHNRKDEATTILSSRRLFQQFIVDAHIIVETFRLNFVYLNQKKFRVDIYKGLEEAVVSGDYDPKCREKRIILPSTFFGGARCMIQNYQDAMAICRSVGYPDLFITFTCSPA
ncbi:hypothetical protein CASFOL_037443 [Castilleja foliolosa]|uniref:Helitron helicase-like domain-containing protein n=1 Tax=Castilleja foliolosa TaxID=1961234 RepID=A0ABD3BNU3_9LAMI